MLRLVYLFIALAATVAFADDIPAKIKASLKTSLPELTVDQVNPTAVANVYEIISGHKVFYVDSSGRYAFLGNMVDLTTKQSITQARTEQLNEVDFNQLPFNFALRQVLGTGERKVAVFTDPDCPFCQRLEQTSIPKLTNVTIYYFLFPLAIHANAETDAKKIICSENPDTVFLAWMKNGKALPNRSDCKNAVNLDTIKSVGTKMGIEATPTIVLPNGKVVAGLVPGDYLNQLIIDASPAPKESGAAAK